LVEKFTINEKNVRKLYPLVSYSFSHRDLLHLICNLGGLAIIGRQVEAMEGGRRLLEVYLIGSVSGGLWSVRAEGRRRAAAE